MARIIKIGYTMYRLPDSLTPKEVQSLVGLFALLQRVESYHDFDTSESVYYVDGSESVQLKDVELVDAATARQIHDESHARYKAKQAEAQSA